jgi:hypothetical protein
VAQLLRVNEAETKVALAGEWTSEIQLSWLAE